MVILIVMVTLKKIQINSNENTEDVLMTNMTYKFSGKNPELDPVLSVQMRKMRTQVNCQTFIYRQM